jgi:hypothetical protein
MHIESLSKKLGITEMYEGTHPINDFLKRKREQYNKEEKEKKDLGDEFTNMLDVRKFSDDDEKPDVMDVFGHGIKTYFKTMRIMMYLMVMFIIILLPTLLIYNNGGHYKHNEGY